MNTVDLCGFPWMPSGWLSNSTILTSTHRSLLLQPPPRPKPPVSALLWLCTRLLAHSTACRHCLADLHHLLRCAEEQRTSPGRSNGTPRVPGTSRGTFWTARPRADRHNTHTSIDRTSTQTATHLHRSLPSSPAPPARAPVRACTARRSLAGTAGADPLPASEDWQTT